MSQQELSSIIGITFQQLQKYERGINRISQGRLWDIACALHTPIAWFYADYNGEEEYNALSAASITETQELIVHYYKIANASKRKKLLKLLQAIVNPEK